MKTYIDFFESFKGEFIGALKFRNKFIRVWGTTTLDGVPVLNERFTVYPGTLTNKNIQRMCKMLGMWSSVKDAKFNTIAGYYLWLNPDKEVANQEELVRELMAEKVDEFCPKGEWKYSTINYVDKSNPTRFDGFTKEDILEYIDNDYRNIFSSDNGFVVGDTLEESAVGKYVLFDDGTEFDVVVVSSQVTAVPVELPSVLGSSKRLRYTGLSVDIKFRRIVNDIDPDGVFMSSIKDESDKYKLKLLAELQASSTTDPEYTGGTFGLKRTKTDEIWYKDRLRVSAMRATGIPIKTSINTLLSTLDTGQIKKKVKWYKKALGFVLIAIAIVLAVTPGTQLAAGALYSLALYVGVAIMVMTLVQAQWAKSNAAAAGYMGRWIRVANIISIATGIAALVQNIGLALTREAAAQAATQSLTTAGGMTAAQASAAVSTMNPAQIAAYNVGAGVTSSITTSTVVNVAKELVVSRFKSIGMKIFSKAVEMRQVKMDGALASRSAYAQELRDEVDEAYDRNLNVGLEDIKVHADNLDALKAETDIDAQYSAELATIHIGNIQRASFYKATGLNLRAEDLV